MSTLEENRQKRHQQYNKSHSLLDYAMGAVILIGGMVILFHKKLLPEAEFKEPMSTIFGYLCLIYGGWRLYRGYKKR